ncbi:TonB-dependent receptor [Pararcticibacter amylolyticus]|uniref:TonB-dependent receptor n=1 Tax=Pararcticibacter amylolyticus TaxID=2173175 RepID=A0A2U2PLW2_9SPHI|nr:TonB-dependent receptor [Pararcticibacter amylolyticus]PWG82396.1 TonB-dependent receptor [Pararcticibacter amylolyticus]
MKHYLLATLILFTAFRGFSQAIISGTIKNQKGQPIKQANIILKNTYDGATSDSTGKFLFSTEEKGAFILLYSATGYQDDSVKLQLDGKAVNLSVLMRKKVNELDAVTITAGTFETGDKKRGTILSSLDVATTAGSNADIISALQTLPGAQTSFTESGLFVRGGSAAETKTFFDGMLIKNPFNTQVPDQASRGRFSPFLFKGTSFSAGGYSALYGQALSSALLLESKDLPEKTTTGLSLLSVGAGVDQNIRFKNSALTTGGFYYNLKPAFSVIKQDRDWDKEPEQYGATLQYKLKTSDTGMFKWYSDFSRTSLGLNVTDTENPQETDYFSNTNKNTYINTSYQDYLAKSWKIQAGLAFSNTSDDGLQKEDRYNRTDRVFQGRLVATHYLSSLSNIKFGAESFAFKRAEEMNQLSRQYKDQLTAAFSEAEIFITPNLATRVGLRSEYSSWLDEYNIAPRASVGYRTGSFSQVSLAYGKFYQNPEDDYLIMQPLDFEKADHYILNYQYSNSDYTFRAEAYYKDYSRLTRDFDGQLSNTGNGYARGAELFWRDRKSIRNADYWISYSFLDTRRIFGTYPSRAVPPFAAKHTLNVVYKQFFEKLNSQISSTYTFATGRTYVNPANPVYLGDKTGNFNNLSLNVSYLTHILKQFTVVYLSATNVPGFNNVYGYHYSRDGQFRQAIQPAAQRDFFIGLLMTIGDNTFVR